MVPRGEGEVSSITNANPILFQSDCLVSGWQADRFRPTHAVPMPSRKTPRLINRPVQQRSRDTHDAIVLAFRQALATTPYDQITVAESPPTRRRQSAGSMPGFPARRPCSSPSSRT